LVGGRDRWGTPCYLVYMYCFYSNPEKFITSNIRTDRLS
jgi:hypothetical protein